MGKRSRDKGMRNENALAKKLNESGLHAERVPLSGMHHGSFGGDVVVNGQRFEVKVRSLGFKQLYDWLADNAGLFVRSDRHEWLIVLRLEDWLQLMAKGGSATAPASRGLSGGENGDDEPRDRSGLWLP